MQCGVTGRHRLQPVRDFTAQQRSLLSMAHALGRDTLAEPDLFFSHRRRTLAGGGARDRSRAYDLAIRKDGLERHEHVLDVAVHVLLHAAGVGVPMSAREPMEGVLLRLSGRGQTLIERDDANPELILTVRSVGYRFNPDALG